MFKVSKLNACWAVVGTHHLWVDLRVFHALRDTMTCQPVVYAPTDIAGAGICPVGPPGVFFRSIWVCSAEGIHKTSRQIVLKTLAFFVGVAVLAHICLWIREVYWLVRHIHISAVHHRLRLTRTVLVKGAGF